MLPPFILLWALAIAAIGLGFAPDQWWNATAVLIGAALLAAAGVCGSAANAQRPRHTVEGA